MASAQIFTLPTTEKAVEQQLRELHRSCELMADHLIFLTRYGSPDFYIRWPDEEQDDFKNAPLVKAVVRALYRKKYAVQMPNHNEPDMLYIKITPL